MPRLKLPRGNFNFAVMNNLYWSSDLTRQKVPQSLDGPIRANRFADSRESPDSRESFQGSRTEPLFCESRFGGLKVANRRFEAIRANCIKGCENRGFSETGIGGAKTYRTLEGGGNSPRKLPPESLDF